MFLYKLDRVSRINYNELESVIKTHRTNDDILRNANNYGDINKFLTFRNDDLKKLIGQAVNSVPANLAGPANPAVLNAIDLSVDSKVSLICLTEAPTYNIIEWGSPTYERSGVVSKQISTGFHTLEVWRSVLFQLLLFV